VPVSIQPRGARSQLRVTHKALPKAFFHTFDTAAEARAYGDQLHAMLDLGIVPQELLADAPKGDDPLLAEVIRAYTKSAPITSSDDSLLTQMLGELVGMRVSSVTFLWCDQYVKDLKLKREKVLAPGTIRKRIGVLGRVLDWHIRRITPDDKPAPPNPLRLLPRGYSVYSKKEASELAQGDKAAKGDQSRNVRLAPGDNEKILAALAGQKREDRERALKVDPAFTLLYKVILATGMRLREAYRLRVNQIDFAQRLIHVEGSKGVRGQLKPRTVPLSTDTTQMLQAWCQDRIGLVFPFWSGSADESELKITTTRLSARFRVLFAYAQVANFTEHDLRHEATCRWVTMRRPTGGWLFSELEICKIMGWTKADMMLRYASLRGEDLSARMA
jgi:integrase